MRDPGSDNFVCNRCGVDLGNGGIDHCIIVSRVNRVTGLVENLHFCEDREEDGKQVKGCASRLLTPANLAHQREVENQATDGSTE